MPFFFFKPLVLLGYWIPIWSDGLVAKFYVVKLKREPFLHPFVVNIQRVHLYIFMISRHICVAFSCVSQSKRSRFFSVADFVYRFQIISCSVEVPQAENYKWFVKIILLLTVYFARQLKSYNGFNLVSRAQIVVFTWPITTRFHYGKSWSELEANVVRGCIWLGNWYECHD